MEMPTHRETLSTGKLLAIRDKLDGSAAHLQLQIEYLLSEWSKSESRSRFILEVRRIDKTFFQLHEIASYFSFIVVQDCPEWYHLQIQKHCWKQLLLILWNTSLNNLLTFTNSSKCRPNKSFNDLQLTAMLMAIGSLIKVPTCRAVICTQSIMGKCCTGNTNITRFLSGSRLNTQAGRCKV